MFFDSTSQKVSPDGFLAGKPYGFLDMSGMFDVRTLLECGREIDDCIARIPAEKNFYGSYRKHKLSDFDSMPAKCGEVLSYLNSASFLGYLEKMTGIEGLFPDPYLLGAGIHAVGQGGFLKIHTDFNWHRELRMHRRLNLLIYLNEEWEPAWGGNIELWSPDMRGKLFSLPPRLGNALLFATSDISYHGHPDPICCPESTYRKSMALYYYSKDRPQEEVKFSRSGMTRYTERPGESYDHDKIRHMRHKLHFFLKKHVGR